MTGWPRNTNRHGRGKAKKRSEQKDKERQSDKEYKKGERVQLPAMGKRAVKESVEANLRMGADPKIQKISNPAPATTDGRADPFRAVTINHK